MRRATVPGIGKDKNRDWGALRTPGPPLPRGTGESRTGPGRKADLAHTLQDGHRGLGRGRGDWNLLTLREGPLLGLPLPRAVSSWTPLAG